MTSDTLYTKFKYHEYKDFVFKLVLSEQDCFWLL